MGGIELFGVMGSESQSIVYTGVKGQALIIQVPWSSDGGTD